LKKYINKKEQGLKEKEIGMIASHIVKGMKSIQ
jgi:hypothetical protein